MEFPGPYDRRQLKDQLFLACINIYMILCISSINKKRQHMKICHRLLVRPKWNGQKVRSLRVKSASVEEQRKEGETKLKTR